MALSQRAEGHVKRTLFAVGFMCLSACSGADGPSRNEYNAKANALCARYNNQLARLGQPSGPIEQQVEQTRRINRITLKEIHELRSITPPKPDQRYLANLYDRGEKAIGLANQSADDVERGDKSKANADATQAATELAQVNDALESFGAKECAR